MDEKVKNLSKMMVVYQMLYMTTDSTRAIRSALATLKLNFRQILTHQEKLYREAEKHQIELYDKAWNLCFVKGTGQVIEIGTIAGLVYASIDEKAASKMIGKKKMDRVLVSYFLASEDPSDAYEVESRSTMFADKIIEMYDGKKAISPLKAKIYAMKQNMIIEGKDSEAWRKQYEPNENSK